MPFSNITDGTSYKEFLEACYVGQVVKLEKSRGYSNSSGQTSQVSTYTASTAGAAGDTHSLAFTAINGVTIPTITLTYTVVTSDTVTIIATELAKLINANQQLYQNLYATSAAGVVTITSRPQLSGNVGSFAFTRAVTGTAAGTAATGTASGVPSTIGLGLLIVQNAATQAAGNFTTQPTILPAVLPSATTDIPVGITFPTASLERQGVGAAGNFLYQPGDAMNTLVKGEIWVPVETTISLVNAVYYRFAVNAALTTIGGFDDAAGAGLNALSSARWIEPDRLLSNGLRVAKLSITLP